MQEGCTFHSGYYKGVLDRLILRIGRVRPFLYRTHDFFPLHDNGPAHSAAIIRQFLTQKTSRNIEPPSILARFVSSRLLPVPEGKVAAERCKI